MKKCGQIVCNSCGSTLIEVKPNSKIGKCKSCGSNVVLPNLENQETLGILKVACSLRKSLKFNEASNLYKEIIEENPDEIVAYEGILLSEYGVIYVDSENGKRIATSRKYNPKSIFDNHYFQKLTSSFSDEKQKEIIKEANEIDKLQREYGKQIKNEPPYDVFISYKSKDNSGEFTEDYVIAHDIYDKLNQLNLRVFFADVTMGDKITEEYEPIIFHAINTAKFFILVGTSKENIESAWVKNEWIRFIDRINCNEDVDRNSFINVFGKGMNPDDMPIIGNRKVQHVNADKLGYVHIIADYILKCIGIGSSNAFGKRRNKISDESDDVWNEETKSWQKEKQTIKYPFRSSFNSTVNVGNYKKEKKNNNPNSIDSIIKRYEKEYKGKPQKSWTDCFDAIVPGDSKNRGRTGNNLNSDKQKSNEFDIIDDRKKYSKKEKKIMSTNTDFVISDSKLIKYKGKSTNIIIPNGIEEVCGDVVNDDGAFYGCKSIKTVKIPGSVKIIRQNAFVDCPNLEKVIIGDGTKIVEGCAFSGCYKLSKIIVPKSVKEFGNQSPIGDENGNLIIIAPKHSKAHKFAKKHNFAWSEVDQD